MVAGTAQPLRRAPNWLRRPAAATFGFGGKLVSVSNARRTLQGGEAYDSRLITISQVRGGLAGGGGPCGSSLCSYKLFKRRCRSVGRVAESGDLAGRCGVSARANFFLSARNTWQWRRLGDACKAGFKHVFLRPSCISPPEKVEGGAGGRRRRAGRQAWLWLRWQWLVDNHGAGKSVQHALFVWCSWSSPCAPRRVMTCEVPGGRW